MTTLRHSILAALCLVINMASAQPGHLLTAEELLSSSLINKVAYDPEGFIWIATEDGLNRYDGAKITVYKHANGDSTSLAHNYVNDVFIDSEGRVLVSSHGGLQIYNPYADSFYPKAISQEGYPFSSSMTQVLQFPNGDLWAIGNEIMKVEIADNRPVLHRIEPLAHLTSVNKGIVDVDGSVWLTRERAGTFHVKGDGAVEHYFGRPDDPIIQTFAIGKDNTLYAGTFHQGLHHFDRHANTFVPTVKDSEHSTLNITDLYCDDDGQILLGTDNDGLKAYNPRWHKISDVNMSVQGHKKLKAHSITQDEYGNMWIGLFQKGVLLIPYQENDFRTIQQQNTDNPLIGMSFVTALQTDADRTLWVGTDNDGIYAVSPDKTSSLHFTKDIPAVIIQLYEDSRQNLWVGSYDKGTGILNKTTGKFTPVRLRDENGIDIVKVYDFAESDDGHVWIATMGGGIYEYDPATRTVRRDSLSNSNINLWVNALQYSSNNKALYAGTYDGLYKISQEGTVTHISPGLIVNDLYIESGPNGNTLWAATVDGLVKISSGGETVTRYDIAAGLPSNTVYAIESDGKNLWISTNSGLSCFDPLEETFTNYYMEDGLHSNEFAKKASCRGPKGVLYFGGVNGLTYFRPENINGVGRKYDLRITDFYIGDKPVHAGMKSGRRTITDEPVQHTRTFKLGHDDNSFSIEFNTMQLVHPTKAQFLYSFDNKEWESMPRKNAEAHAGGSRLLTFSNVESGMHTLRLKVIDNGVESDVLSVRIDVAPVWYWSWWAKAIYLLLLVAAGYEAYRIKKRRDAQKRAESERNHQEEIKEAKLQFFTNISHEIRTPLTLVLSPLQRLLATDSNPERSASYRTMMRNAHRVLRLVNELLDLRKIDNKQMRLQFTKMDLVGFLQDLYETFSLGAANKGITMTFNHEGLDTLEAWIDKSNFDKVIVNLLSNAIKYTPKDGSVAIKLSKGADPQCAGPLREYAEITVTDTGIGIPVEERGHIFDRFYRVSNNKESGTGIGLHLTNLLVNLHHGAITVADNPEQQGSQFTVRVPLGNEHLNEAELATEDNETPAHPMETASKMEAAIIEREENEEDAPAGKPKMQKLVYIVEDDLEVQKYLTANLGKEFKVTAFANGKEALEATYLQAPDLIITDVMMPEMDGITFTHKIRQNINLNHTPIIMLTAKIRQEDMMEGLEAGVDEYITKPFNIDILIKKVKNLLESRQRLRNAYSGSQKQEDKVQEIEAVSNDDKLMERVMRVINKHISDSDITVEMIAEEIGISRVHLHRKLKELTNQTTRDFIRNIRLQQAAKLLREKKLSVSEVSYLVGFKHPNNFSTNFKEMYGMSPSQYSDTYYGQVSGD